MTAVHRRATRIICLDAGGRVLLLRWQDPVDGHVVWEPPGGGLEPGESHLDAARRELAEETGLDPAAVQGPPVTVHREFIWNGRHYAGPEEFFVARFTTHRPALDRAGLMPDEQDALTGYVWLRPDELAGRAGLEPPELPALLAALPTGT